MDARLVRPASWIVLWSLLVLAWASPAFSAGAVHETPNFVVHAPTPEIARKVGEMAEHYRDELALIWLGKTLPRWYRPCPIHVRVGQIGAGGATSFSFDRGEVFGWRMQVQGTLERILDSVLPHEINHTIFACHFRRPLPRWADEGAATLVEYESEQNRQRRLVEQILRSSNDRIPLRRLLGMKEYPRQPQQVMALYAQGFSLADFLVQREGRSEYLLFLETAHRRGWDAAIRTHYGLSGVDDLEQRWNRWVTSGSPRLETPEEPPAQLADARDRPRAVLVRAQNPDEPRKGESRGEASRPRPLPRTDRGEHPAAPDPRRSPSFGRPTVARESSPAGNARSGDGRAGADPIENEGWVPVPRSRQFSVSSP